MNNTYLIAAFFAFILSGLLLSKKKKLKSNLFLSSFLSAFGVQLILFYSAAETNNFYGLLFFRTCIPFLYGPLLYFYTFSLTDNNFRLQVKSYLHFLPFIAALFIIAFHFYIPYSTEKIKNFPSTLIYYPGRYLVITSVIFYIAKAFILLKNHRKMIADKYSFTDKINLCWLTNFIYGFLIMWALIWVSLSFNKVFGLFTNLDESHLIYSMMSLYILALGIFGLRQTNLFSNLDISEKEEVKETKLQDEKPAEKKDKNWEILFARIDNLVKNEKLYLEPLLTIDDIAGRLAVNSNYISNAINVAGDCSFFEYVNKKRIEEFKEQLKNPDNADHTLLAVAFQCGFNSRSSFNRIFKNLTGETPSQYKTSITG